MLLNIRDYFFWFKDMKLTNKVKVSKFNTKAQFVLN